MNQKQPAVMGGVKAAAESGLRYVSDLRPGIRRFRKGKDFRYELPNGRVVRELATLKRIKSLVIPPAWKEVWICPDPQGHIQAVGRDDRGRKQYRYHPRWREVRDETKFNRMIEFGKVLPKIRRQVRRELRQPGLGRKRILAAVVRLLELTALRVGNDEYANNNKSYGLTTLRHHHAKVRGATIQLNFRGKSGKQHSIDVEHPTLSRIVKKCQDLPGQDLFQYLDEEGNVRDVTSGDVNAYLAEITGKDFTAKDFRTWTGTVLAALALREFELVDSKAKAKRNIVEAIARVAKRLGNTPAVCKKCYIHPVIFDSYLDGTLVTALRRSAEREMRSSLTRLRPEEAAVVALLQQRLKMSESDLLRKKLRESVRLRTQKRHRSRTPAVNGSRP
ncbi:MAG TPA: DNA topoisomerase IB [Verrucomicrobiae bacterium]|nr:DNA topoisomerase IB [Verrucomicrobiae bacterium]